MRWQVQTPEASGSCPRARRLGKRGWSEGGGGGAGRGGPGGGGSALVSSSWRDAGGEIITFDPITDSSTDLQEHRKWDCD